METDSSFSIHHRNIQTLAIEIFKFSNLKNFWMDYPRKLWMTSSRLNRQPHTICGIKMDYIVEAQNSGVWDCVSVVYGTWNLVNSTSGIEKLSISVFFQKKYKEMETKLSMSVMQNLLATCWFYMIIMCGSGIKIFLFCQLYVI